jgi:acetyl esterase/lipase
MTVTESFSPDFPELLIDIEQPGPEAPPAPATGRPVIVWLHGGGWRLQDRTARPDFLRHFAARGFTMASIDYRLAPQYRHPAQVEDLRQALRWLRANSRRLGIDPARIGLWGSSAGGHVAAYTALTSGVQRLVQDGHMESVPEAYAGFGTQVSCVVEGYGPAAIDRLLGGPAASAVEQEALLGRARAASPAELQLSRTVPAGPPPFFILHGVGDTMVPPTQSQALHECLTAAGGQSLLYLVDGFGHGFRNPGEVQELGPGIRLDNGRLEAEPNRPYTVQTSATNQFDTAGQAASFNLIGDYFAFHLLG